jgi:hypothetical protein
MEELKKITNSKKINAKAKAPLHFYAYALLFCLSIIALNPFALLRGTIWTQPKIFCVALIVLVHLFILWQKRQQVIPLRGWWYQACAWSIFLAFGLVSTVLSPFPIRSLIGHEITADGLLYWFLMAGFVLTNNLVLKQYPNLLHWQLRGILVGATLVALSIYPQLANWKLDYTVHSGQLWTETEHILVTAVYRDHQPIGLYSHRGYAAFTLAIASVLSLGALQSFLLPARVALPVMILCAVTLSLAKVRGAIAAMLAGWLFLALSAPQHAPTKRTLILLSLIGVLSFSWVTVERRVRDADIYASTPFGVAVKHFTSDRVYLWQKTWSRFLERPWIGWGLNGYSIADATELCPEETFPVVLEDYYVQCQSQSLQTTTIEIKAIKAHNILLDWMISIGIPGTISYISLILSSIQGNKESQGIRLGLLICYQFYGITWFDCAQITHLGLWGLSTSVNTKQTSK